MFLIPAGHEVATVRRLECFDVDALVHIYDGAGQVSPAIPVIDESGGPEPIGSLRVERHDWLLDLLRWAELEKGLVPMHRHNFRSWRHRGKIVLKLTGAGKTTLIAGVGAKNAKDVLTLPLPVEANDRDIARIKAAVERGIAHATGDTYQKSDEHMLQMVLQRNPQLLELEPPLSREFPAFRPEGIPAKVWSRGFIDLLGQDFVGDIVVVETKLGTDPMVLLQAIDYWQWVQTHRAKVIAQLHLHSKAEVRIRLAVGKKGGKGSHLHAVVPKQLALLRSDIAVDVFVVSGWESKTPTAVRLVDL